MSIKNKITAVADKCPTVIKIEAKIIKITEAK
jgi:hypothetical protein